MSIVTLYHGQKGYKEGENEITTLKFEPQVYLTDNYEYALSYTNNNPNAVYEIKVDTTTLLDCRKLGGEKTYFEIIKNFLYKTANIFTPVEIKQMYMTGIREYAFWQIIRMDDGRRYKPQFVAKGYNGLIMIEETQNKDTGRYEGRFFTSFVLFNNKAVISINKANSLSRVVESTLYNFFKTKLNK